MIAPKFLAVCALALVLAGAPSARADVPEHALVHPAQGHRLWLRALAARGEQDGRGVLLVAPRFAGAFLLADRVDLDIEVPLLLASVDPKGPDGSESRTRVGNPFLGASYVTSLRRTFFSVGGGATVPLAHVGDPGGLDATAFRMARAARAGREAWLYTPDRLAVVMSAGLESHVPHGPVVGVDAALALLPRVRGDGSAFAQTTQLGVSVAAQLGDAVRLGGRLDAVLLSSDEPERLQAAFVPFLRVSAADGMLFGLEATVNLDSPYGSSFASGGVWGASLYAGSRF